MKNKSVNTASFYYSLNMLKLLQDMNLVTEDEVAKIKKSLSEHYGVTMQSTKRMRVINDLRKCSALVSLPINTLSPIM